METHTFQDFDAFVAAIEGADCTMQMANPECREWTIQRMGLGDLEIQRAREGSGNLTEGVSAQNAFLFFLPLPPISRYSANGQCIGDGSFMILEPGTDFSLCAPCKHAWCTVVVPAYRLPDAATLGTSSPSGHSNCRVTPGNQRNAVRFQTAIDAVFEADASVPGFHATPAAEKAESAWITLLANLLEERIDSSGPRGRPEKPRRVMIDRVIAAVDANPALHFHMPELAAIAGVSERTLRSAFCEFFNMAPARVLRLRRLHQIRHALMRADPEETSVSDILTLHGEWQFGRFARRYHKLFGEVPSETLRTH